MMRLGDLRMLRVAGAGPVPVRGGAPFCKKLSPCFDGNFTGVSLSSLQPLLDCSVLEQLAAIFVQVLEEAIVENVIAKVTIGTGSKCG